MYALRRFGSSLRPLRVQSETRAREQRASGTAVATRFFSRLALPLSPLPSALPVALLPVFAFASAAARCLFCLLCPGRGQPQRGGAASQACDGARLLSVCVTCSEALIAVCHLAPASSPAVFAASSGAVLPRAPPPALRLLRRSLFPPPLPCACVAGRRARLRRHPSSAATLVPPGPRFSPLPLTATPPPPSQGAFHSPSSSLPSFGSRTRRSPAVEPWLTLLLAMSTSA